MEPQMEYAEYGDKYGQLVVYFHGAPGAIEECAVFANYAKDNCLRIICFDRFSLDSLYKHENYYQEIANHIKNEADGEPIDIIGFSIGTHVAFEVMKLLNEQVRDTHLISAVAPIKSGCFIDEMAGGFVFKLAMKKPFIFTSLTIYQKFMALLSPQVLVNMLFASAAGEDKKLIQKCSFRCFITPLLKHCFGRRANGYMRDINLYVKWQGNDCGYSSNVYLWHGTKDNWSPFAMASYLCGSIPSTTYIKPLEGLSHYSCLFEAAPKICALLKSNT